MNDIDLRTAIVYHAKDDRPFYHVETAAFVYASEFVDYFCANDGYQEGERFTYPPRASDDHILCKVEERAENLSPGDVVKLDGRRFIKAQVGFDPLD